MTWTFVGRAEQLESLRVVVSGGSPGLVMITGAPGIGRSAMLSHALEFTDPGRDSVVRLKPSGTDPLAALRHGFPDALAATPPTAMPLPSTVAKEILRQEPADRLVVAADDAHRMDQASLLALREMTRSGQVLLLVTCPAGSATTGNPDPSGCFRYEEGLRLLTLRPLGVSEVAAVLAGRLNGPVALPTAEAIYAATAGIPRRLRALAAETSLATRMVLRDGQWRFGPVDQGAGFADTTGLDRTLVAEAAWRAWRELASERADQLCRLALWCGVREEITPIWATLLLLRGHPADALAFLESLPCERVVTTPRLSLVMALTLALGLDRVEEADDYLARAARRSRSCQLTLAHRAWLLAVTGRTAQVASELAAIDRTDLETATFIHAAKAVLARVADCPREAAFHLRRALATAESGSTDWPWLRPFLRASLIDSMLLCGRAKDAASIAGRFHAHEPGSGWELTVFMDALLNRTEQRTMTPASRGKRGASAGAPMPLCCADPGGRPPGTPLRPPRPPPAGHQGASTL
jgi:hypothetical protein